MLIRESWTQEDWVVEDTGLISGVKLCGIESANGRKYPQVVFERAKLLYENAPIFLNHAKKHPLDRDYSDHLGLVHPTKVDNRGLFGSAEFKPSATFESVKWDLAHKTAGIGFSHSIEADVDASGVVQEITRVFSVDLVLNAATNKNFFESEEHPDHPDEILETLKLLLLESRGSKTAIQEFLAELQAAVKPQSVSTDFGLPGGPPQDKDPWAKYRVGRRVNKSWK